MNKSAHLFLWALSLFFSITASAYITTAQADIQATYDDPDSPNQYFIVEIADNGAMRFTGRDGSYLLILDGQAFDVEAGPGGPIVKTAEAVGYSAREAVKSGAVVYFNSDKAKAISSVKYVPEKEVIVTGYRGTQYFVPGTEYSRLTLSIEPKLLPLGKALFEYFKAVDEMSADPDTTSDNIGDLVSSHGVLEFWRNKLVWVSNEKILHNPFKTHHGCRHKRSD
jgi:hypothetical protein